MLLATTCRAFPMPTAGFKSGRTEGQTDGWLAASRMGRWTDYGWVSGWVTNGWVGVRMGEWDR